MICVSAQPIPLGIPQAERTNMRVLHFLQSQKNKAGDPLAHVLDLAKAQADNGHAVGIVCLDESNGHAIREKLAKSETFCTLGILHLPIDPSHIFSKIKTTLPAYRSAAGFAQTLSPDLLHGHGINGGDLACTVKKALANKKIKTICVTNPHEGLLQTHTSLRPFRRPETLMKKQVNGIIFESAHCETLYTKRYGPPPVPTRIIHDGLAKQEFAPRQIIDMASDFLFVGELAKDQGIDILVQALARMKKSHPTGALIAGSGPQEAALRTQVNRYGLSHEIFFNSSLDVRTAFLKGSCLVLPSKASSIPRIVLLAAAAGVPMILTNVGGIRECVGEVNMPLIPANDTGALAKQMIAYLENPQPFLARATALKQRVGKHFTLERLNDETEQFYQSLIDGKR